MPSPSSLTSFLPPSLTSFLPLTVSDREVSLAIVADENESQAMRRLLRKEGYEEFVDPFVLVATLSVPGKRVLVISLETMKPAYDLVAQYPTGSVQLFDGQSMTSTFASPKYADSSLLLLVTEPVLASMSAASLDPRGKCGLAYRR